jgi:hypothetical protein
VSDTKAFSDMTSERGQGSCSKQRGPEKGLCVRGAVASTVLYVMCMFTASFFRNGIAGSEMTHSGSEGVTYISTNYCHDAKVLSEFNSR